ncbi:hypothetical protein ACFQUU_16895 [Herbaspirillum sp. GCM10030257]|uniref:hypothetical protein n=1 Tax=Herbaspirillum sp. GCM10030257 TaxID=3273393 RepID=UPI0036108338
MKALIIKDLAVSEELDARSMAAVRGGCYAGGYGGGYLPSPSYTPTPAPYGKGDFKFDATQMLNQSQNTVVNNGNNAAFVSGITSNVTPTQNGSNNIGFL